LRQASNRAASAPAVESLDDGVDTVRLREPDCIADAYSDDGCIKRELPADGWRGGLTAAGVSDVSTDSVDTYNKSKQAG
jgi:hypothetical protein